MNNNALKYAKKKYIYLSRILTKPVYMHYVNNEKTTQLMHLCGPISAFCYSQSFNDILCVETENAGLILTRLNNSKGRFSHDK